MRGTLKIDYVTGKIIMSREFAKAAKDTFSPEYLHLQEVKRDNPTFTIGRKTIKKNEDKETWKGLTYSYMELYIKIYEPVETRQAVLDEFDKMILISKCHGKGKRYPVIKKWFLDKYTEVKEFGMPKEEEIAAAAVLPLHQETTPAA